MERELFDGGWGGEEEEGKSGRARGQVLVTLGVGLIGLNLFFHFESSHRSWNYTGLYCIHRGKFL